MFVDQTNKYQPVTMAAWRQNALAESYKKAINNPSDISLWVEYLEEISDYRYYFRMKCWTEETPLGKHFSRVPGSSPKLERIDKEEILLSQIFGNGSKPSVQKFGIELETENVNRNHFSNLRSWKMVDDCSLFGGTEFVSIPLEKEEAKSEVYDLCASLSREARNSDRCGLHVHTGYEMPEGLVPEKCQDTLAREKAFLAEVKPLFEKPEWAPLLGGRFDGYYCRFHPYEEGDLRYKAVNFQSYEKHRTIEIRCGGVPKQITAEYANLVSRWIDIIDSHFGNNVPSSYEETVSEMNTIGQAFSQNKKGKN